MSVCVCVWRGGGGCENHQRCTVNDRRGRDLLICQRRQSIAPSFGGDVHTMETGCRSVHICE